MSKSVKSPFRQTDHQFPIDVEAMGVGSMVTSGTGGDDDFYLIIGLGSTKVGLISLNTFQKCNGEIVVEHPNYLTRNDIDSLLSLTRHGLINATSDWYMCTSGLKDTAISDTVWKHAVDKSF